MKTKTTKLYIKAHHNNIIDIPNYCNADYLLLGVKPWGYCTRVEGWAFDVYTVGATAIISGYASMYGSIKVDHKLCNKLNDHAKKIYDSTYLKHDTKIKHINHLLDQLIDKTLNDYYIKLNNVNY